MRKGIIKFTVNDAGGSVTKKYRFYLSKKYCSDEFNFERGLPILLILNEISLLVKLTCGNEKKGFDLYHEQINLWIIYNGFESKVVSLEFEYKNNNEKISLKYLKRV